MKPEIKAINCTSCGGTLDVLGGHRVKSLTCGYCGSVMDRHAGFQTVQQYRKRRKRRLDTPLSIGMKATLKGVSFTIIGMIEYVSHQSGEGWKETYRWASFQLYSPTHGYCWLTWNMGHYFFSYRTRDLPTPVVPEPAGMPFMPRAPISFNDQKFEVFESYHAEISYVEGELTWIAKLGDKIRVVEAIAPPRMFSYEQTKNELEYSIGEYMDAEKVGAAFGITQQMAPFGVHPAQPFNGGRLLPALAKVGPIFAFIALLGLIFVFIAGDGREIARYGETSTSTKSLVLPFNIVNPNQLIKLELSAPITNNWAYYDVTINDAVTDEPVLALGKEVSFYEGRDSDGYWSEGSKRGTALFKVPAAGDYEIEILLSESSSVVPPVTVRLYEQVFVKRYLVALLVLSAIASAALPLYRRHFERRRWADVLGDDDD